MSFIRVCRKSLLILSGSLLGCLVSGCAGQDRDDSGWRSLALTPDSVGMIDPSIVMVRVADQQRASAQQQLVAAGFQVQAGAALEVRRTGADQAGFARDLKRMSDQLPGAVHLVVQRNGQRVEVGDGIVITPRNPDQLPALLARHQLQAPQVVITTMVRVVTQPRSDLLRLDQRMAALRADPDIIQADFDLIIPTTLK